MVASSSSSSPSSSSSVKHSAVCVYDQTCIIFRENKLLCFFFLMKENKKKVCNINVTSQIKRRAKVTLIYQWFMCACLFALSPSSSFFSLPLVLSDKMYINDHISRNSQFGISFWLARKCKLIFNCLLHIYWIVVSLSLCTTNLISLIYLHNTYSEYNFFKIQTRNRYCCIPVMDAKTTNEAQY